MIDALLFAVKDAVIANLGYDVRSCDIRDAGNPPPGCGDVFVAVHQGDSYSNSLNSLDEYFGFNLTLTMRVTVPLDRIGDQLLARRLAKKVGFNRRCEALRAFCHMAWGILGAANDSLVELAGDPTLTIYGFVEPAHYSGMDRARLVGHEWFEQEEDADRTGLVSELRFVEARRMQPIGLYL